MPNSLFVNLVVRSPHVPGNNADVNKTALARVIYMHSSRTLTSQVANE